MKRIFLVAYIILLITCSAFWQVASAATAFVQAVSVSRTGVVAGSLTTGSLTTLSGNSFIVAVSWDVGNCPSCTMSVSDNKGNVYSQATSRQVDARHNQALQVFYVIGGNGGAGHTFTATPSSNTDYVSVNVHEVSGLSGLDQTATNNSVTGPNATIGSITTTLPGDYIFAVVTNDSGSNTFSANTPFTERSETTGLITQTQDYIQPSVGPVSSTWTISGTNDALAQLIAFKSAQTSPSSPVISSFSSSPTSISQGNSSTLSWSVSGNPTPTLSISNIGTVTGNSTTVSPSQTTTYTLTAINSQGTAQSQTTVTVTAPPPPDTTSPSTPTSLSATAVSSSQINLSWTASTDNVGVTGYKIYRAGTQIGTSVSTNYQDSNLQPQTSYSYTISAYDAAGNNSSQSTSASATTQAQGATTCQAVSPAKCWYVDGVVSSSGNGTSWASAWKAISNITGVSAGDFVYFSGGANGQTYSVTNWAPIAGTKANPVTYAVGQDAGRTGMVTFNGSGNFLQGTLTGITVDGEVSGTRKMTISSSYNWTIYSDTGSTNGFKFLYVNFTSPIWGRGTGYEIAHSYGVAPLSMNDDSYIAHIGENGSNHTENSIHDNYFQVWRIRTQGFGQDLFKWVGAATIYNNVMISAYNASYPGNQHDDGIQTAASHVWMYNNYIEGFISYPIYNEMYGNTTDWRIYNNVINSMVADHDSIDWGAFACMALGWSSPGVITDYIVANNTCIGPTDTRPGITLGGGVSGGSIGSGVYAVNNLGYNSGGVNQFSGVNVLNNYDGTSGVNFVNISSYPAGDFHLTSGATNAINKGINPSYLTSFFTTDKDGVTRPQGSAWDIGAYEYISGSPTQYTIGASAGSNGSISPSGTVSVNSGYSQTFNIVASSGYQVASVLVDGINQGAISSYTFSNITTNHTISAAFTQNTTPPSTTFSTNDRVYTNTTGVNIRNNPGTTGTTILGTHTTNDLGTIISNAQNGTYTDGYYWWNVNFDSGVDGWVAEPFLTKYTAPIVGDFNHDGLVNSIDLSLLTSAWNTSNSTYDLNSDGIVNSLDYVIMVQNWSV